MTEIVMVMGHHWWHCVFVCVFYQWNFEIEWELDRNRFVASNSEYIGGNQCIQNKCFVIVLLSSVGCRIWPSFVYWVNSLPLLRQLRMLLLLLLFPNKFWIFSVCWKTMLCILWRAFFVCFPKSYYGCTGICCENVEVKFSKSRELELDWNLCVF